MQTRSSYLRDHAIRMRSRRAFTLFEVMLALALITVLMAGVAGFYQTSLKAREQGRKVALEAIQTRAMLERLADEIRNMVPFVPGDGLGFEGTDNTITIVRTRLPSSYAFEEHDEFDTLPPAQMDIVRVTYHLYWDEEDRVDEEGVLLCYGVWRTEQRTFDPNPKYIMQQSEDEAIEEGVDEEATEFPQPDVNELYAPEIKFLRFEYYDGLKWRDRWNVANDTAGGSDTTGSSGGQDDHKTLPQAVRITMGRIREPPPEEGMNLEQYKELIAEREKREPHPDRFMIVVAVPQADQSLLSSRKKGAAADIAQMGEQTEGGR